MASEPQRQIALSIDADLHRRIRVLAATEDKSMNAWIREALAIVVRKVERA
jgi:predicted HicB family RNase H-like nuclease